MADEDRAAGIGTVVLVEGESDREAVVALSLRMGRDLVAEGVAVVAMGGVANIGRFVDLYGPAGARMRLVGLCDRGETGFFARAFGERPGRPGSSRFFVCDADLEDELIRAMGTAAVLDFIEIEGDLRTFSIMQRQPAQRDHPLSQQLHRFIGVRSGRKARYAVGLVEMLELERIPRPLERLLRSI